MINYWIEKSGKYYMIMAYNPMYNVTKAIKTYCNKKDAEHYIDKINNERKGK